MATSYGTKVTNDPQAKEEIPEAVGIITSDSLAAESLANNGEFGRNNPKAGAMSQPSRSTTTNNRDASSATTLAPAKDSEDREAKEGRNESEELNAGRGLGKATGRGPTYATPDNDRAATGRSGGGHNANIAPTGGYAGSAEQARGENEFKPHGKNITEGGFDSNAPNASFNQEIGTDKDPGRLAEQNLEGRNVQNAYDSSSGSRQSGITGEGTYDPLRSEEQA
ncbi:hypothetical protein AOQ84DRAFT_349862 [Glonium stellatum]|uniref:Uncharacterized protein n=1 Tax=Glonium stellatum TaxID=574774 RepID=A0A8E2ENL5_9PEZI|nr:hypothetical protein AOQ84DRAFT_349862 [Glonium stellatum]